MAPDRLRRETWLSLRQAACRIGRELLGAEWSDRMLDKKESRLLKDMRHDLYLVLSSGEVKTLLGDGSHYFDPRFATWPGFKIDIQANRIEVGEFQERSYCQLNSHDLDKFLSKYRDTRHGAASASERSDQCLNWLCRLMASPKTKSKRAYEEEAARQFGISGRAFGTLWSRSISVSGNGSWSGPGRPKSKH